MSKIDESITFATLPAFDPVKAGEMIATVKIIPFAVEAPTFERALASLAPRRHQLLSLTRPR